MSPVADCWDGVASLTREEEGGGGWLMLLTFLILGPRKQNRRRPRCVARFTGFDPVPRFVREDGGREEGPASWRLGLGTAAHGAGGTGTRSR